MHRSDLVGGIKPHAGETGSHADEDGDAVHPLVAHAHGQNAAAV